MLKLMEIEGLLNILDPIFGEKISGNLAWELIELINELQPYKEKIDKLRKKLVEDYAIKKEDGTYETNIVNDQELFNFGENSGKVEEELKSVLEVDIETENKISVELIKEIEIEPIKLKILYDKNLIRK